MKIISKKSFASTIILLTSAFALSACNNVSNSGSSASTAAATAAKTASTATSTTSALSFSIVNAFVTAPPSGSSTTTPATMTLAFNATSATQNLSNVCMLQSGSSSDGSRACKCRYTWAETNISATSVVTRTADTIPTAISAYQVQCPVPTVYANEISDGTVLKLSLIPDAIAGNNSGFTTNVYNFTKSASTSTGDFRDAEGKTFKNIFHYVCFDKSAKDLSVDHHAITWNNPITGGTPMPRIANTFKTGNANYSAQSYYYDLYIRGNDIGAINSGSSLFTCPLVNINGVPSPFPLDTSFALALSLSKDYPIQINAPMLAVGSSLQRATIGYAAKMNADGSCPSFLDSNSQIRRTFRLRQYQAVYPIRYGADGTPSLDTTQKQNSIFVLDRPVNKTGQDPLKPITRLGPKPCPFSYKTAQFGYKCQSDSTLTGWNIDGTQINGDPECPVYPPPRDSYGNLISKTDGTLVIRPYKAFTPHYVENTNFKACAFQSSVPVDPEIVLAHDDNVYSPTQGPFDFYCAKHYPKAGDIIPPPNGDPFDKPPSECSTSDSVVAIKGDKSYACSKTFDPFNGVKNTPQAGCCQICSGTNCGVNHTTAAGRNAAFSPPLDSGNPASSQNLLIRAVPNQSGGGGCFDPSEP